MAHGSLQGESFGLQQESCLLPSQEIPDLYGFAQAILPRYRYWRFQTSTSDDPIRWVVLSTMIADEIRARAPNGDALATWIEVFDTACFAPCARRIES